ncbi:siroheme synthase [Hyphomicrobium sp.]|uniref:siroheme synthase n=1 Tax=Hyphomicrobium sp. TaxID=82 RepID=UPI002D78CD67|nr:NAD(P)-dependent oxidoreductase [Hyphomicrobium sp.]HET6389927.1 NAD(P)-dependent oxidoreductase [Hyphomicrobium sp.]
MADEDSSISKSPAHRIDALAVLPVFFKLDGKRVVLAGGGEPSLWKAELLAASGARVEVFSQSFAEGFQELAASPPNGKLVLTARGWTPEDLASAAMAIGAFSDDAEAAQFASAARAAGVPVNVVDRPAFCDFQFGAIVNRSPLVVGISTDGAAPVFGQAIRSLIESLLPVSFKQWADAARRLRGEGEQLGGTMDEKRRFWQRFTDLALRSPGRGPRPAELDELMRSPEAVTRHPIIIIEIGAGGAEGLTLGAVRTLRSADDIFFDEAVPAEVAEFARREARRYPVRRDADSRALANDMITAAEKGGRMVRLRMRAGSDAGPDDEADLLREAQFSVVVVPPGYTF